MPQDVKTILDNLEPLLSAALGLNLALISIPAFTYVLEIAKSVDKKLAVIDQNVKKNISSKQWYKSLEAISKADVIGLRKLPSTFWINTPASVWGVVFNLIFFWRLGKILALLSCVIISYLLLLGAALKLEIFTNYKDDLKLSDPVLWFWISVFMFVWPFINVMLGIWVKHSVDEFISYQLDDEKAEQISTSKAAIEDLDKKIK